MDILLGFIEILPSFSVGRANRGTETIPEGRWGLIYCNDPDIWFDVPFGEDGLPLPTPDWEVGEDENAPFTVEEEMYLGAYSEFAGALKLTPHRGHLLYTECLAAGYDPGNDGNAASWLWDRVVNKIREKMLATPDVRFVHASRN